MHVNDEDDVKRTQRYRLNKKTQVAKERTDWDLKPQSKNIGPPDVPRTPSSNVPRTSPKDPIWLSRGHPDLTFLGRPDLTSWGRLEMMSRGRPNLMFKGRPWEIDSGRPQNVLRTSPRGPSGYSNLDVLNFSFKTYSIDQIYIQRILILKVFWEPSQTSNVIWHAYRMIPETKFFRLVVSLLCLLHVKEERIDKKVYHRKI